MEKRRIKLGFTEHEFEAGAHICQIFNDDDERHDALVNYVISGVREKEQVACFTENETDKTLSEYFSEHGIEYTEIKETGAVSLSKTADVYFQNGKFDPDRMLGLLQSFYEASCDKQYDGARVIGEMVPEVENVEGGSRLLEYESRVSLLLRKFPITAVCQYDARVFDGSTIMNVLKVHPYMIIRGAVVSNPFFIKPEDYLKAHPIAQ